MKKLSDLTELALRLDAQRLRQLYTFAQSLLAQQEQTIDFSWEWSEEDLHDFSRASARLRLALDVS